MGREGTTHQVAGKVQIIAPAQALINRVRLPTHITYIHCYKIVLMFYNVKTLGAVADLEPETVSLALT